MDPTVSIWRVSMRYIIMLAAGFLLSHSFGYIPLFNLGIG